VASLRDRLKRQLGTSVSGSPPAETPPDDPSPVEAAPASRPIPPPPSVKDRLRRLHRGSGHRRWNFGPAPETPRAGEGLHHGYGNPRASVPGDREPTAAAPVPRRVVETDYGGYIHGRVELPPDHGHGDLTLASALQVDGAGAVLVGGDSNLVDFDPTRALYFDLETTGLPGGGAKIDFDQDAGPTLAILIGAVRVRPDGGAIVDQILMRDARDEYAALHAFEQLLDGIDTLVSFNGKSFDRHVLADRFAMQRLDGERLREMPHLDLIHPARRLYRRAMDSCTLKAIEEAHLGVFRSEDIPGSEVPRRWRSFARSGDDRRVEAVLDHNTIDLLTLLTLSAHLVRCVRAPGARLLHPSSLAAAGKLLLERGDEDRGEALLRRLSEGAADDAEPVVYGCLHLLAEHLRRTERYDEAVSLWRRMRRVAGLSDLRPWTAEAIALEHRLDRVPDAVALVERLLEDAGDAGKLWHAEIREFEHRLARLRKKSARGSAGEGALAAEGA